MLVNDEQEGARVHFPTLARAGMAVWLWTAASELAAQDSLPVGGRPGKRW